MKGSKTKGAATGEAINLEIVPENIQGIYARQTVAAMRKFFEDPQIQKEYKAWKKKRKAARV